MSRAAVYLCVRVFLSLNVHKSNSCRRTSQIHDDSESHWWRPDCHSRRVCCTITYHSYALVSVCCVCLYSRSTLEKERNTVHRFLSTHPCYHMNLSDLSTCWCVGVRVYVIFECVFKCVFRSV